MGWYEEEDEADEESERASRYCELGVLPLVQQAQYAIKDCASGGYNHKRRCMVSDDENGCLV